MIGRIPKVCVDRWRAGDERQELTFMTKYRPNFSKDWGLRPGMFFFCLDFFTPTNFMTLWLQFIRLLTRSSKKDPTSATGDRQWDGVVFFLLVFCFLFSPRLLSQRSLYTPRRTSQFSIVQEKEVLENLKREEAKLAKLRRQKEKHANWSQRRSSSRDRRTSRRSNHSKHSLDASLLHSWCPEFTESAEDLQHV